MRGDPPVQYEVQVRAVGSTPHARGSTCQVCSGPAPTMVYPACAGIHPRDDPGDAEEDGLPRMRGDPPRERREREMEQRSTPHARGSTLRPAHP